MSNTPRSRSPSRSRATPPPKRTSNVSLIISLFACLLVLIVSRFLPSILPGAANLSDDSFNLEGDWVRLQMLDVGQGDALLLTSSLGETMLIDAGSRSQSATVLEFLAAEGIKHLDYVIATHPHEDHIGGMAAVIQNLSIGSFYLPDASHTTVTFSDMLSALESNNIDVYQATAGMELPWKMGKLTFLYPPEGAVFRNLNNASVLVHLSFGTTSFLLAGDLEKDIESDLMAAGVNLQADFLKVAHHGSTTSTSPNFLAAVDPVVAFISCGAGNSYGHPHQEILDLFSASQVAVYRTDLDGHLSLYSNGTKLYVSTSPGR